MMNRRLVAALLISASLLGCTAKDAEPVKDSNYGFVEVDTPGALKEIYDGQVSTMPKIAADFCRIKKTCRVFDGELIALIEACFKEKYPCGGDQACKDARDRLRDPAIYVDGFGRPIMIANSATKPQLVSYGADKKPGGSDMAADIVFDIKCN